MILVDVLRIIIFMRNFFFYLNADWWVSTIQNVAVCRIVSIVFAQSYTCSATQIGNKLAPVTIKVGITNYLQSPIFCQVFSLHTVGCGKNVSFANQRSSTVKFFRSIS